MENITGSENVNQTQRDRFFIVFMLQDELAKSIPDFESNLAQAIRSFIFMRAYSVSS